MVLVRVLPVPRPRLVQLDGGREPGGARGPRRDDRWPPGPRRLPGRPRRRLGQPRAARGLRAAGHLEDPRAGRRHARLVDRLLRRLAASSRGQGVAAALLDAADRLRREPTARRRSRPIRSTPTGERIPAANAYHGTLAMFERAGFTVVERRQWNATTPVRPIVRLALCQRRVGRPAMSRADLRHLSRIRHRRPSGLTSVSSRRVDCRPARMSRARILATRRRLE